MSDAAADTTKATEPITAAPVADETPAKEAAKDDTSKGDEEETASPAKRPAEDAPEDETETKKCVAVPLSLLVRTPAPGRRHVG